MAMEPFHSKSSAMDLRRKPLPNYDNCFYSLQIFVSNHEEHTLMRRFDKNGDGVISMEEFYNTLADVFD